MAFAPKFDLFEYHLNQSSSDQFDFAQKRETLVLSDNHLHSSPHSKLLFLICFSTITKILPLHARQLMLPKVLQLKTHCL
jgi:hypothetical protein